jgi:RimJ/RimL family protein N-acetyltransferase
MSTESDIITSTEQLEFIRFSDTIPSHASFLLALWNTDLFISLEGKTGIDTPEKALGVIQNRYLKEYARNGYGTYILRLKPAFRTLELAEKWPEHFVGTVSLSKGNDATSFTAPDLGFATVPEMTGKGIATEAAKGVLAYADKELGVKDVFGLCDPDNKGSRRVIEKSGLEFRGIRKLAPFGGVMGAVYCTPSMNKDLSVYNLQEES